MRDLFRDYLKTRLSLGEDELFLTLIDRRQALEAARRLSIGEQEPPSSPAPAAVSDSATSAAEGAGSGSESKPESGARPPSITEAEAVELGATATGEQLRDLPDLATLDAVAQHCVRCGLHRNRRTVVFGEGNPEAHVVCVGEAPGAREDETGRPFVGRAGQLLDRLLLSVGFRRREVFICNVLKCRPPQNRNPQPDEIAACSPFLVRQIGLIAPRVIVAFGSFAAQTLLGTRESIGRLRGRTHLYQGYPLVVTYHPAALLRNPGWTRKTWEDLQTVRRIADDEPTVARTESNPATMDLFANG